MKRRQFLAGTTAGLAVGAAGCVDSFTSLDGVSYGREPELVADRPAAIYYPTHTEEMAMGGMAQTDDGLAVSLAYTFPHRFWRVFKREGRYEAEQFSVDGDDAIHIMANIWDAETGVVLPVSSVDIAARGGNNVDERETVYPMLSQRMGFHYGDNYHLDGDDTYTVNVTVGATTATRFGGFEGRFDKPQTVTINLDYSEAARNELAYETYEDRQGDPGALSPMRMEMNGMAMPTGSVRDLGGTQLGTGRADDIRYAAAVLTDDRFGDAPYLAVTAATRYNELVVPSMGLAGTLTDSNGETVVESTSLEPSLDPELGFHYGAVVPGATGEETATIDVTTPPQVARHEGYETAFFETPTVELD
ncbi:Tat pathway signal protein [Halonotius aquaticus]|uniref:Tat pathway signal protein n=1 Tax=Halonotius aquaticus TaxID=2216978 RepID=A0A3A6PN66_9EURY|nr:iron transporter [Halonotius aquaticus]RJX42993.1 Tat pathway signal protein [Halonotius aquaticus]